MFKRPSWATSSAGPASSAPFASSSSSTSSASPSGGAPSSSSSFSPSAAAAAASSSADPSTQNVAGQDDPNLDQVPGTTNPSIFQNASRTHNEIVAEQRAATRLLDVAVAAKERAGLRAPKAKHKPEKRPADVKTGGRVNGGEEEPTEAKLAGEAVESKDAVQGVPSEPKRRRINAEDSKALLRQIGVEPIAVDDDDDGAATSEKAKVEQAGVDSSGSRELEEDSDDEVQIQEVRTAASDAPIVLDADSDDEENDGPELRELRRKARERHKQMQQHTPVPNEDSPGALGAAASDAQNPVIRLLVDSPIPETRPVIIHRNLSARLQEVRLSWCQKQHFSEEFTSQVFLAYCGRRKYDITTIKSLGLEVDAQGTVTLRYGDSRVETNQIRLEATTEEILSRQREEKARQDGQMSHSPAALDAEGELQQQQVIRLIVKTKDETKLKVKVTPGTVIANIIATVRLKFEVASNATAYLFFDGERLNPEETVQDTDIEDESNVEFHVSEVT